MLETPDFFYLLAAGAGLIIGGVLIGMIVHGRWRRAFDRQLAEARAEQAVLRTRREALQDSVEVLERQADQWRLEAVESQQRQTALRIRMAELETTLNQERKQANEKIILLKEAREQLNRDFQVLAQRIFDEKGAQMVDWQRAAISQLIDPLRTQIGDFKRRVENVYDTETRDRIALYTEINHLKRLNQQMSQEALNLTRALKGDSKTRGQWGEMVLARVLETSGLQKGREYEVQVALRDRAGRRYQPDAIVRLPEGKDVVIDAKVSLNAYEAYHSAEASRERADHLAAHIESMRGHVRSLAGKSYEDLEGLHSLDFTLMFVPIEAAFLSAVEKDGTLFTEALENNVVVVTPSTLLVTLRIIQNTWRQEFQNRHALEIAQKAGALYDKFVGFAESLQEVGQMLDRARSAYRAAHDRLVSGQGNLVRRTEALKALGAKAGKNMPRDLLESAAEVPSGDE